jgi:hypothetical protein
MRVRFKHVWEFLVELTQDAPLAEDHILRLTQHVHPIPMTPLAVLSVRAGVMIKHTLIELHQPVGEVSRQVPSRPDDARVRQRAKHVRDMIAARAGALGLTVRPGRFLP